MVTCIVHVLNDLFLLSNVFLCPTHHTFFSPSAKLEKKKKGTGVHSIYLYIHTYINNNVYVYLSICILNIYNVNQMPIMYLTC